MFVGLCPEMNICDVHEGKGEVPGHRPHCFQVRGEAALVPAQINSRSKSPLINDSDFSSSCSKWCMWVNAPEGSGGAGFSKVMARD